MLIKSPFKNQIKTEIGGEGNVITVAVSINTFKFLFCFWKGEKRLSFFIDEREIIDEYFENFDSVNKCVRFLIVLFYNIIERRTLIQPKTGKILKQIYTYALQNESEPVEMVDDVAINKSTLFQENLVETRVVQEPMI